MEDNKKKSSVKKENVKKGNNVEKVELINNEKTSPKKSLGSLVLGIILLIVLIAVFVISKLAVPTYITEVNYSKYEKIVSKDSYIMYYGNDENSINILKEIGKSKHLDIYYIDVDKLSNDEKSKLDDTSSRLVIKNGDVTAEVTTEITNANVINALISANILNKGIQTISVSEYLNVIKEPGYHFMFIGSSTCSWCTKFKPELESVIDDYGISVYYVDLSTITDQSEYDMLISSNSYFTDNQWGTPTSFIYKDGVSLTAISGYKDAAAVVSILKEYKVIN